MTRLRLLPWPEIALGLLATGVLAFAVWWVLIRPEQAQRAAVEAKAGQVAAEGQGRAARDAINVITGAADRDARIDQAAKEAEDEIRKAPADQRNAAALRRLCLSDAYRREPACRELR